MSARNTDDGLGATEPVDASRRAAMLGMARALAYVPPAVATFALTTWSTREAKAYTG